MDNQGLDKPVENLTLFVYTALEARCEAADVGICKGIYQSVPLQNRFLARVRKARRVRLRE